METLCAVRQLCAWKIPNIEIFFNSPRELKEEYVQQLHQLCQQSGTQVVSVHPFTSGIEPLFFFSEYPGRFEDGIELFAAGAEIQQRGNGHISGNAGGAFQIQQFHDWVSLERRR